MTALINIIKVTGIAWLEKNYARTGRMMKMVSSALQQHESGRHDFTEKQYLAFMLPSAKSHIEIEVAMSMYSYHG